MKVMRNLLSALLAAAILCSSVFAASGAGFNASLEVDRPEDGVITVTVQDSTVLAEKQPTLTIPCDYTYAKVTCPDGETVVYCTIENGGVSFTVSMGGIYTIEKIDALPEEDGEEPSVDDEVRPVLPAVPGSSKDEQEPPEGPEETVWVNPYSDVDEAKWYFAAVKYATENKLMNGVGDGKFAPNGTMTRAMLWTILARLEGVDTSTGSTWDEVGRQWAMAGGISDGTNPTGSVTREQMVTMLWRYQGEPLVTGDHLAGFPDSSAVSGWAAAAMNWAVANGVIKGSDGKLNPSASATRAEVAQVFMNYFGQ